LTTPIALNLTGTFPKGLPIVGGPKSFFLKFSKSCAEQFQGMVAGGDMDEPQKGVYTLGMQVHPATGPVRVTIQAPNTIKVTAFTASVGPGYHQYLCDTFLALGQKHKIAWSQDRESDPTGYFFHRDRRSLESAFLRFLADAIQGMIDDRDDVMFYPPLPHEFEHDGEIATPLGPRSAEWMVATAHDPQRGRDVFAWWDEGLGANYHLGRALAILWNHARFRPPLTEDEGKYLSSMLSSFEAAHRLAPHFKYPWREWFEFMKFTPRATTDPLYQTVQRMTQVDPLARSLFGYRCRDFKLHIGSGWIVRIPGIMAEATDERGWQFWDGQRTVQVAPMPAPPGQSAADIVAGFPPLGPGGLGEEFSWERGGIVSKGNLHRANEDGRQFWRLGSIAAVPGSLLIFTINFDEENQREWALATWRALEWAQVEGE